MSEKETTGTVACQACRYYHVTWDPQSPYGCHAHGFKSKRNPALVVYESSGLVCQLFELKIPPPKPGW